MTEILATQTSSVSYDDGNRRDIWRVTSDGTVQTGTEKFADRKWVQPTEWTDWTKDEIIRASRSPNGMKEQQWFCRLPAEVRQAVRVRYGLVATASHPCAGAKDGCKRTVAKAGEFCDRCQHDA